MDNSGQIRMVLAAIIVAILLIIVLSIELNDFNRQLIYILIMFGFAIAIVVLYRWLSEGSR